MHHLRIGMNTCRSQFELGQTGSNTYETKML